MGSIALLMLIVGGFLAYEVFKSIKVTPAAALSNPTQPSAPTGGNTSPGSVTPPAQGRLFPQAFYNAIAASESGGYNPPSGCPNAFFGISGSGTAGSCPPQPSGAYPGAMTPALAIYNTPQEAFQAFDNLLSSGIYSGAFQKYQSGGNFCQFVSDIAPHYAYDPNDPSAVPTWIGNIHKLLGCS